MAEYTATPEGFQRAIKWSCTGSPEDLQLYAEATLTADFYLISNDTRWDSKTYVDNLKAWSAQITDYNPVVHEFLRDGNQLAARITGTFKKDGAATKFERFMFAKVNAESGKLEWLVERYVGGPIGGERQNGVY